MQLSFRTIQDNDLPFLKELYASSRAEELAAAGMTEEQQKMFLAMQFEAQHNYYHDKFSEAAFELILGDSEPIGRRYIDVRADELRILDLVLLPEHRGKGIGTRLLAELQHEGSEKQLPVRIILQAAERSRSLFERLGFQPIEEDGPNTLLEWRSKESAAP